MKPSEVPKEVALLMGIITLLVLGGLLLLTLVVIVQPKVLLSLGIAVVSVFLAYHFLVFIGRYATVWVIKYDVIEGSDEHG